MSLCQTLDLIDAHGFPRVSGDEPAVKTGERVKSGFSPRERG